MAAAARPIEFRQLQVNGRVAKKRHPFEGFVPYMERRYRETQSPRVREELAKYLGNHACPECEGTRLNRTARFVFVGDYTLPQIAHLSVGGCPGDAAATWTCPAGARKLPRGSSRTWRDRLRFLKDVGLDYLTLDRSAETLSGGEAQRIRLASQVGSGLTGVMYILDEPSIGLHQRDNARLLGTLAALRDTGNTVIVVEHDTEAILAADHVVDLGPGAGVHGGSIVASGTPDEIKTQPRLAHRPVPERRARDRSAAAAHAAQPGPQPAHPRRHAATTCAIVDVEIPLGALHLRHRRLGLGQIHADQRHAVQPCRRAPERHAAASRRRAAGSRAWSTSTG